MAIEMLINVSEGEECRIALIDDGKLEELYMERTSSTSHVGNIYKGRVTNVEPSIQAAFVDFGLGRNGFLHISDVMPTYFGRAGEDIQESVGRKMARRDRPPIQRCLRRGDEIIVQIIKEGIGTKGPTLSTYLSVPGRILVMMPGMSKLGVSRKIEDEPERRRLRTILDGLKPPKDVGFIIRTAGVGKTKTDIQRDFTYLTRVWTQIENARASGPGPMELYTEGDLVTRAVRDVLSTDVDRIIVDNKDVARRIKEVVKLANPRAKNKVELYEELVPLFHKYDIEREIEQMYSRHVPLPGGGSLVIDSTEAVVAIDVNSGKFRDHNDAETTAFKTDMEAAEEIPRQLKLRDLGGVIICDFIDLRYERHRRELEKCLHDNFRNDRAKTKVLPMSQFGIVEITRQRMRPSLKRSIYFDCPHCKGSGLVKTPESMSLDVMRRLAIAAHDARVARVELAVCPDVAYFLQNKKRVQLANLEIVSKKRILIRADAGLGLDEQKLELFDLRDGFVYIQELGMAPADQQGASSPQRRHQQPTRGRRDGRGGQPQRGHDNRESAPQDRQLPAGRAAQPGNLPAAEATEEAPERDEVEDRYDIDGADEGVEDREEARVDTSVHDVLRMAPPDPTPLVQLPGAAAEEGLDEEDSDDDLPEDEATAEGAGDEDEEEGSGQPMAGAGRADFGHDRRPMDVRNNNQRDQRNDRQRDQRPNSQQRNDPYRDQRNNPPRDQRQDQRNNQQRDQRNNQQRDQRNDPQRDQRNNQQRDQRNNQQRNNQQQGQRNNQQRDPRNDQQRDQRNNQQRDPRNDQQRDQRNNQQRDPRNEQQRAGGNNPQRDQRNDQQPDPRNLPQRGPGAGPEAGGNGPSQADGGQGDDRGPRRRRRRGGRGRGRRRREAGADGIMPAENGPGADMADHEGMAEMPFNDSDNEVGAVGSELAQPPEHPHFEDAANIAGKDIDARRHDRDEAGGADDSDQGAMNVTATSGHGDEQAAPEPELPPEPKSPRGRGRSRKPAAGKRRGAAAVEDESASDAAAGEAGAQKDGAANQDSESSAGSSNPRPASRSGGRRRTGADSAKGTTSRAASASRKTAAADTAAKKAALIAEAEPTRGSGPRAAATPAAKTGSTDRHLISDDPVIPDPPRRPRTYRDLDEIPEDIE